MDEQRMIEEFDLAVDTLLGGGRASSGAGMVRIASYLRGLPREEFRSQLGEELARVARSMKEETMTATAVPVGYQSLMPYLIVNNASGFIDFLKNTFGAKERVRVPSGDGGIMHAEVTIEDSVIELADSNERYPPRPGILHMYVPDVDATYRQALDGGATSVYAVLDQDYGDREASVKDGFGNTWYLATHKAAHAERGYVSPGLRAVTPYLHPVGTPAYIEFLKAAFDAQQEARFEDPDGRVAHARLRIGDSAIEMGEAHGVYQPVAVALHVYLPDVDAVYRRAIAAGAKAVSEPADMSYGDRAATITDPIGNTWFIATRIRDAAV
jgi:uncharacterized glyoxalase superfamily protein PhnB